MSKEKGSLQDAPTWAVSILCLGFFLLSVIIDVGVHHLTEFLKKTKRKSLDRALGRIKTEMMILGFISLLLTILEAPISKICAPHAVASSFLPCKDSLGSNGQVVSSAKQLNEPNSNTTISIENKNDSYCETKGMVSLVSRDGIKQLNIFISVLAVFHILYCLLTMCLGIAKMRKWRVWEEETQTLEYQIANDPRRFNLTRQTSFGRQHLRFWTHSPLLLWPVSFIRQFRSSVSKADYFTLRNGFIMVHISKGSNFNFQKFLARAFDDEFEQVVGISFWIWIFSILFILFSAHAFHSFYWLPFIPLLIALVVGTKLEVIITQMCLESSNGKRVTQGTLLVKPNDHFFWFGRPKWLLHLLQFILIQNSFQLAFFTWTWYEYGLKSCFNRATEEIVLRVVMGVAVQFLCGYVTLPLHALVTQMGSGLNTAVFTERVATGLKHWHKIARHNLSMSRPISTRNSSDMTPRERRGTSFSDIQNPNSSKCDKMPPSAILCSQSNTEITEENVEQSPTPSHPVTGILSPKQTEGEPCSEIVTGGSYDGEISFARTWKETGKRQEYWRD